MNKKRIILITGMSGAGKTSTMAILEDMGYHCIDQFPVKLLSELTTMILEDSDPRYDNIALATSVRDFLEFRKVFAGLDMDVRVLILEASNEELLSRYKQTRRSHPMLLSNLATTLDEAIHAERDMLNAIKDTAFLSIDTTFLKNNELKSKITQYFSLKSQPIFSISFISFGYKNGVPMDADLLFDVRFLPNPYWIEALRPYSGNDACVYDYVIEGKETKKLLKKLTAFLDYAFKEYMKEGKNHFTVGIGCTGGQHRSVAITNWLYDNYKPRYHCFKQHRDTRG